MEEQLSKILKQLKPELDLKECNSLIEDGILDSFDIVFLVGQINREFNIDIGVEHIRPEYFRSMDAMLALITLMQKEG